MLSRRILLPAAAALLLVGTLVACGGSEDAEQGPDLPPAESMAFDISLFATANKGQWANFNAAALRVWWLEASVGKALVVPAASLAAALSVNPTFEDGRWIWDFETTSGGKTYGAHLEGWFENGAREGASLNLEMSLTCSSCDPPLDNFLYYEGRYDIEDAAGYWQFYSPEVDGADKSLVRADWSVPDATHSTLDIVNNRTDGNPDAGDRITLTIDGDQVTLTVHDESEGLDYGAGWSSSTTAGWVQVPNYNDGQKACWDSAHVNVECGQE